ncbi:MAG TPA: PAS domain-containing protein [Kofleriaceae bacterium]|nr:PAS domain-containing protein [Kofleriaceae bacterium]
MVDYAALFEASPNPYMVLDRELRYVAANSAYCETVGRTCGELIGRRIFDLFPHDPEDPNNESARRLEASFLRVLETGQRDVLPLIPYRIPVNGRLEDRFWSATHTPLFDRDGEVAMILQHTVDVTELARDERDRGATTPQVAASVLDRAESAAEHNEQLLANLGHLLSVFEQAPGFLCLLRGPEHIVELANAAYLELVGQRSLLGRTIRDAFPDIGPEWFALLDRVYESGEPFVGRQMALELERGGARQQVIIDFVYQPIRDRNGATIGVLVAGNDITQQVHAEAEREDLFREAERARAEAERTSHWLQEVLEQVPVPIAIVRGPEHVIELANDRMCAQWGRRIDEVLGKPLFVALPELAVEVARHRLDAVRTTGVPYVGLEERAMHPTGPNGELVEAWFNYVAQPLIGADESVESIVIVSIDVTFEVRARQQVSAANAELQAMFESFPEAVVAGDATGFKRVNSAARELLGYSTPADLMRPHPTLTDELAPHTPSGEVIEPSHTPFQRALRGDPTRMEMVLRTRDGEDRTMFASAAPIRVGDAITGAVVTLIDVTAQREARTQVEQLARVLDAAPDFVGIANLDGMPTFLNRAGLALVGLPDVDAARALPVIDYVVERQREQFRDNVLRTALERGQATGDVLLLHRTTGEEIPVSCTVFTLRDTAGQVTAIATITRDLRGQQAAEAERAQLLEAEKRAREQAEQANLLKDQFLAVVSHELRTPLAAILGWMHMLRSGMLPAERHERALETVERNARVQAQLIEDLLDVSRIVSGKLELERVPTDVAAFVGAGVDTIRPSAEAKGVRLEVALDFTGQVCGDAQRLQQVVWNLLSNAVKFTKRDGTVTLHVGRDDGSVVITVRDTGAGIPREFLPHVFEQFRQAEGGTARKLGGLGIGLSIVKYVVAAHGGEVRADSDGPGTGATFTVRLPIHVERERRPSRDEPDALTPIESPAAIAGIHVLVVDDDDDTREYVRTLLARCQARVTTASNAADAFDALVREHPDVLVSDIGMPEQDGYHLIRRVRALPNEQGGRTPAVALTAFASMQDRTRAMLAGYHNHVTKPIEPGELLAAVAALADRR